MFYKLQGLFYRKNSETALNLLNEMCSFINLLPDWVEKPDNWLIANPSKKIIAIENGLVTQEAIDYVNGLIDSDGGVNIVLADENEDDSVLTISYRNAYVISNQRYSLSFTMKYLIKENDSNVFMKIVDGMISLNLWDIKYIVVDTEQYKRKQRSVFPDRLPVGWVLFLPIKIEYEDVPSASVAKKIENGSGTIIVSKNIFNGKDAYDISCANNVEMELASKGLLPLIKGL